MNDNLTTFIMSSGLISLSIFTPISLLFTIAGAIGCSCSAVNYIDEIIHKKEEKIFKNCDLINKDKKTPKIIKKINTDDKLQMVCYVPEGISINSFEKHKTELESAFKMPINMLKNDNYTITLESIKQINFKEFLPLQLKPYELQLCNNITINMNKFPHLLLGGDTGTGKSRVLLSILTQLINKHENIDLYMLQVRKNDLGVFKKCKQVKTFSRTIDEVLQSLIVLDEELQRREKLIDNFIGIYNVEDYNKRYPDKAMNYTYVIVDEFSFLNVSRGDSKEEKIIKQQCLKYIKSIVNVGRSSGVFLITSLQKPTADSIPSDIKSQLVTRVSMRIQDGPTSQVVLGTDEATKLKEREIIIKTNQTQYGYSYTIEHNLVKNYIKESIVYTKPKLINKPKAVPASIEPFSECKVSLL